MPPGRDTVTPQHATSREQGQRSPASRVKLFLCGDVMTGRGIDQILPQPSEPGLFEPHVRSAVSYVEIAEQVSGAIPRRVDPQYVWGDALAELERARPDARIVNLETAVTAVDNAWRGKVIHYRMQPANVSCLSAARIDCCALANNHVLDWGYRGLAETLATLRGAGMQTTGAGSNAAEATSPALIELAGDRRALVFAYGSPSAGVPLAWAARRNRAGVSLLDEFAPDAAQRVARDVLGVRRPGDLVIVSLHWGGNWGYQVPREQRAFAHRLIEEAGVDLVHGHSSHHPRPIEVYRGKLILYGCGDFLNDYEGIGSHESFRPELCLMYLPELDAMTGRLLRLALIPMRILKFRVSRASAEEAGWLQRMLNRESGRFGTRIERRPDDSLELNLMRRAAASC